MGIIGALIRLLARCFSAVGRVFNGVAGILNGFLPVLLSPSELSALVANYYKTVYTEQHIQQLLNASEDQLSNVETEIIDRWVGRSGRILVLACGWGRETLAIAKRGVTTVGVDRNYFAVRMARDLAHLHSVSAHHHQADFLHLPYAPRTFEAILMPTVMYSSIPGAFRRQTWLTELVQLLKPNGEVMLSFYHELHPVSRLKNITTRLNLLLVKMPWTNQTYQRGDECHGPHFLHAFQSEEELRKELAGARVAVRELDWARSFAVLTSPPHKHT